MGQSLSSAERNINSLNIYTRIKEISQLNILSSHLKKLEKTRAKYTGSKHKEVSN